MRSIRRIYLYAVALVSLEVVVWGVIGLLRTLLSLERMLGGAALLAQGLSLTLVGLPVFLLHWGLAQRDARRDPEEAASRLRAVFLYAVLLITLVPLVQNGLALVDHLLLVLFGLEPGLALIGPSQTWSDNLVAIVVNGAAAFYFYTVLRRDWRSLGDLDHLVETRRLYTYIWMVFGLGLTVFGVQQVLRFILYVPSGPGGSPAAVLANGLSLLLVGTPLWVWTLQRVDELMVADPAERESLLRRVVLYLLALAGVGTVLSSTAVVLGTALRWVLGDPMIPGDFINRIGGSLSIALPLAGVWGYYSRRLRLETESIQDNPRRAALRRLYNYILALFGLGATVYGMNLLLSFLLQAALGSLAPPESLRGQLANAIAGLAVGLPLWLLTWRPMQGEAAQRGDAGDHARRSLIRKAYLYLVLFLGVVLSMTALGRMIYVLLSGLLGERPPDLLLQSLTLLLTAALLLLWTVYHLRALREDGRVAQRSLAARHALFPTILLDAGDGSFGEEVVAALKRQAPNIPVAVQKISLGIPGEEMIGASAVVLPASLAAQPPEALRIWLQNYPGRRLVVPSQVDNWYWLGLTPLDRHDLANQVALALRQMAEGQPVRLPAPSSPWVIVGYVFAALFALEVIAVVLSLLFSRF